MTLIERMQARIKTDEADHIEQMDGVGWHCGLCDSDEGPSADTKAAVQHGDMCPLGLLKEAAAALSLQQFS